MDYYDNFDRFFSRFDENSLNYLLEFGLAIVGVLLVILLVALVVAILLYVFRSAGLHAIATRRGIHNGWLAWIPVAQLWILGCISDQYQYVVKGKIRNRRKILLGLSIGSVILSFVTRGINGTFLYEIHYDSAVIGMGAIVRMFCSLASIGISVTLLVYRCIALYDLYSSCCPENNALFLVLGILFPITVPFFIFFNRKKDYGMPPRVQQPVYGQTAYQQPQEHWNNQI